MAPKLGIWAANTIRAGGFAFAIDNNTVIKGGYDVFLSLRSTTQTPMAMLRVMFSPINSNAGSRISAGYIERPLPHPEDTANGQR